MATQITTKEALGLDDGSTDGTVMASGSKAKKVKIKAPKITANTKLPPNPFTVSYTHLTLPTKRIV